MTFVFLLNSFTGKLSTIYVNSNKLLKAYHGAIVQHEAFQVEAQGWQRRVDSLSTELQALTQLHAVTRATKEQQLLHYREVIQQQAQQEN